MLPKIVKYYCLNHILIICITLSDNNKKKTLKHSLFVNISFIKNNKKNTTKAHSINYIHIMPRMLNRKISFDNKRFMI